MTHAFASVNGTLTDLNDALVPVRDRGFQYGDGLFETMRALGGKACFLGEHMARMTRGLASLNIEGEGVEQRARHGMRQVLSKLGLAPAASVKVMVTRGVGPGGPTMRGTFERSVVVIGSVDERTRGVPLRAITSTVVRNERSVLSRVKSLNYAQMLAARGEAEAAGVDEAIVLNTNGRVAEASAANVFLVHGGELVTPADAEGCLPGIMRAEVCRIARDERLVVTFGAVSPQDLAAADEAFLTNSGIGVAPLVELDGKPIGARAPGALTTRLAEALGHAEEQSASRP